MPQRRLFESFNVAMEGFMHVMKTQRNMRLHFMIGLFFALLGIYLNFTAPEILILSMTITFVLVAEMINTALELMVDLVKSEYDPVARIIKDVSAGAVLVSAVNSIIVGYLLFAKRVSFQIEDSLVRVRHSPWHLTFLSIILVLGVTVMLKMFLHKGTPFRGGMPSGHASVAFSVWTIIMFLSQNPVVITLTFILAFIVARHRIKDSIHTVWEIIAGALLGALCTTLIFQLLR